MQGRRDCEWIDGLKGIAIVGVVVENWANTIPHECPVALFYYLPALAACGGTLVHIFFALSGYGLTRSYYLRGVGSWRQWLVRRLVKVAVPYWVIVSLIWLLANALHAFLPTYYPKVYSAGTWVSYLTFTRFAVPEGWSLNPAFWFMPVIAGLYLVFPLLIRILDRFGSVCFWVICLAVTYGSVAVALLAGYPVTHQAALPVFHILQFAAGMFLAHAVCRFGFDLRRIARPPAIAVGALLYALSALLSRCVSWGPSVNDLLTATGAFLMLFPALSYLRLCAGGKLSGALANIGGHSYMIYLVHMPFIRFGVAPFVDGHTDSRLVFLLQVVSIPVFLGIAIVVGKPLRAVSRYVEECLSQRTGT